MKLSLRGEYALRALVVLGLHYETRHRTVVRIQTISEHDKAKVFCPKCKGKRVVQNVSAFMTKTSRKS